MPKYFLGLLLGFILSACSEEVNNSIGHQECDNLSPDHLMESDKSIDASLHQVELMDTVDISWFLNRNENKLKRMSPREQLALYYPAKVPEGSTSYEFIDVNEKISGDTATVTMIHDNQAHIVVQGHKIIMKLVLKKGEWKIISTVQQFKCWNRSKSDPLWSAFTCS